MPALLLKEDHWTVEYQMRLVGMPRVYRLSEVSPSRIPLDLLVGNEWKVECGCPNSLEKLACG